MIHELEVLTDGNALPVPSGFTDAEVAAAFGELIRGLSMHCGELGGWFRWDGTRWKRDTTQSVFETARQYALGLATELVRVDSDAGTIRRSLTYRGKAKIDALVGLASRLEHVAVEAAEFDRHHHLLCCANGVVDLRSGEIRPNNPELRITKTTGVAYRPDASHADVDRLLDVVDEDVRGWLQVLFGYAATGLVDEDVLAVFDGRGSNGKTTLLSAVVAALGDYAAPAPQKLLMRGGADEHPTLLADLHGRRLVTVEETAEGGSLRVETMKALTGGSPIKARYMRRDYFTFQPTHQLVVATNHRPAVNSTEHATWRRLRLVPFPHRYEHPDRARPGDRPIDLELRRRLHRPAQREALLTWIVAGARRWYSHGLPANTTIDNATLDWRHTEDPIARFAADRLIFDPDAWVHAGELYQAYTRWCETEHRPPGSQKEFAKRWADHDLIVENNLADRRTNTGRRWQGVGLQP